MGELKIESWNMLENQRFKKQAKNLYIIGSKLKTHELLMLSMSLDAYVEPLITLFP